MGCIIGVLSRYGNVVKVLSLKDLVAPIPYSWDWSGLGPWFRRKISARNIVLSVITSPVITEMDRGLPTRNDRALNET